MNLYAVYGTLKQGHGNNVLLQGLEPIYSGPIKIPFVMADLGAFPGLVEDEEERDIFVEVYKVPEEREPRVDRLEGYPSFYNKRKVSTPVGDAYIYFLNKGKEYRNGMSEVQPDENNIYNW